ncbi:MAG: carbohydrate ABC transporter permease [Nitrospinota bacterium]|nr:MAG: carbohydrate ABC transporter permease [Nitrospinota bacterium]
MKLRYETRHALFLFGCYLLTTLILVVVCFPLYWMLITSLKPLDEIFDVPPTMLPVQPTLSNYKNLFLITDFGRLFLNSLKVSTGTTLFALTVATLGAYSLTRFEYPGRELFGRTILFTYMFPGVLMIIPLVVIFARLGLTDTHTGLVLANTTFALPFSLWVLRSFFQGIPLDLEEAAMIDGAGRLGAFWDVVLPQALPGIIATGIFTFIWSWNEYLFALVLISTESLKTLPPGMMNFISATNIDWGLVMAASVLITLPMAIVFMFVQKHLVTGIGAGGVKG